MSTWTTRMNVPFSPPAGTHRLFDLITPSHPDFAPAFYMSCKDTLVAEDLEAAVAIAYEGDRAKYRVVTKQGEAFNVR